MILLRYLFSIISSCRHSARLLLSVIFAGLLGIEHALAQSSFDKIFSGLEHSKDFMILSLCFVFLALIVGGYAFYLRRTRNGRDQTLALSTELAKTRARLDRARLFLNADPQIVISWDVRSGEPDMEGDMPGVFEKPTPRRLLNTKNWLPPSLADSLNCSIERLRKKGESFQSLVTSISGHYIHVEGRAISGHAVLRLKDVSGDRLALSYLKEAYEHLQAEDDSLKQLLNHIPHPVWLQDSHKRLTWVNEAYVSAVGSPNAQALMENPLDLLDTETRLIRESTREPGLLWETNTSISFSGNVQPAHIMEIASGALNAGIALSKAETADIKTRLEHKMATHERALNQLSTAIIIFDSSRRVLFYNKAYEALWGLGADFLSQNPTDSEILDRLRATHHLPEQADYRSWKKQLFSSYQQPNPTEHIWYLPDSRTLKLVISSDPSGGITYLFEDVTQSVHLESRYNGLIRVQSETLDTLKEGVAVFGTDGRLKLFNKAFSTLWQLNDAFLREHKPHIDDLIELCTTWAISPDQWDQIRSIVVGLHDARHVADLQMTRKDDLILDCTGAPLPDGATLLTFTDVTASVNVERALRERNHALVRAEKLSNDFVHHVSYELRSPLTNIIGFVQLLNDGNVGPLNTKQQEYVGYVMGSSTALLAIINDILDLASIDAGAMDLEREIVDIDATIRQAAEGLTDRLAEADLRLNIVVLDNVGSFYADKKRICQILFNLLSNAIGFSAPGQTITLAALRVGEEIIFKITDQGRGIPVDVLDHVFDRFHSHTRESRHRGVGLGLSIVRSFVELHGGHVYIDSVPGQGTIVTCVFPARLMETSLTHSAELAEQVA